MKRSILRRVAIAINFEVSHRGFETTENFLLLYLLEVMFVQSPIKSNFQSCISSKLITDLNQKLNLFYTFMAGFSAIIAPQTSITYITMHQLTVLLHASAPLFFQTNLRNCFHLAGEKPTHQKIGSTASGKFVCDSALALNQSQPRRYKLRSVRWSSNSSQCQFIKGSAIEMFDHSVHLRRTDLICPFT